MWSWRLERLARRVGEAVFDPSHELDRIHGEVKNALNGEFLNRLGRRRWRARRGLENLSRHKPSPDEESLRLLRGFLCVERVDFEAAEGELARCERGAARVLIETRIAIARGTATELSTAAFDVDPLPPWIIDDTQAQLALVREEAPTALALQCSTVTRLRAHARLGDELKATPILDAMAPSRIEAMCRLFPGDPVTVLVAARKQARSPYR
jgi:hypothetical protein